MSNFWMSVKQDRLWSDATLCTSDLGLHCLLRFVCPNTKCKHVMPCNTYKDEVYIAGYLDFIMSVLLFFSSHSSLYLCPAEYMKKPYLFLIFSQSDYLIWIVAINSHTMYLMANSADPDQLASSEANWSGSTLFAKAGYIQVQQDKS